MLTAPVPVPRKRYGHGPRLGVLIMAVWLAACYTTTPLEAPVPVPETRIVAQVTDSGAAALGATIGPGALEVEGVVAEADPDVWKLQLLRVDDRFGASNSWRREVVSFPRYTLTRARVKRLDRTKSGLAAGGIVLGAFVAAKLFINLAADEGGGGVPDPAAILLVPWPGGR